MGWELPRVLVVDDDPAYRFLVEETLDGRAEVVACPDAYQALSALRSTSFDVIVVDLMLPGASGVDLIERMDSSDSSAPVIVITGLGPGRLIEQAFRLGVWDVVDKSEALTSLPDLILAAMAAAAPRLAG